jgi:phosphoribosylanthranilate isomerase
MSKISPTKIKICGLTREEDAFLAAELGAWAIGMIFYEQSPRRCSLAQARKIVEAVRGQTELCGVFVNSAVEEIVSVHEQLGLSLIQLHGDESPGFCSDIAQRTSAPVIKARQIGAADDLKELDRFQVDLHLLDTQTKAFSQQDLRGGTGETFDWELVQTRRSHIPFILSGGINSDNVGEAIRRLRPYGICSASRTETVPGIKDPARLRSLFYSLREGDKLVEDLNTHESTGSNIT